MSEVATGLSVMVPVVLRVSTVVQPSSASDQAPIREGLSGID